MGQPPSKSVEDKVRIVLAVLRGEISTGIGASCLLGLRRGLAETSCGLQCGRLSRHRRGVATKW